MAALRRGVVAVALALGAVGCGTQAQPDHAGSAPRYLSAEEYATGVADQEELMTDGSVTRADYELAVNRFVGCLTGGGAEVDNRGWDPVGDRDIVILYRGAKPGVDMDGYGDECLTAHLSKVSERYTDSTEPVMAGNLVEFTRNCLRTKGVTPTGEEKSADAFRKTAGNKSGVVNDCVIDGMKHLYPGTPVSLGS
ncbi:MAG: hypothetical protein ABIQ18_11700 [Umezawaea sp.]